MKCPPGSMARGYLELEGLRLPLLLDVVLGLPGRGNRYFGSHGEILKDLIQYFAGEAVQPVKVEDGKACDACQE